MTVAEYRKKPVVVSAIRWTGENTDEVVRWCDADVQAGLSINSDYETVDALFIPTLEGHMEASVGDFIIKGVAGEFYPCKPDIFWQTYEPVQVVK